jgi:ABC-type transport system involved in multi-copper enzyme maturation permease subunit
MTGTNLAPATAGAPGTTGPLQQPGPATQFARNATAEWIKLRSVRSTILALLATAGMCVAFSVLMSYGVVSRWDRMRPEAHANFHAATNSVSGVLFGQLVIGALGVLAMSAEYSTGTIRATVAATPQRLMMYASKIVVFLVTAFVVALATTTTAFLTAQAILQPAHGSVGLWDAGVPRIVVGAALFLVAVALLGLGLAAVLRHTAGAISTVFGLMLVLPLLARFLPDDWQTNIDKWLPLNAGMAVMQTHTETNAFGPWTGLAVLSGYALIALAAGAVVLVRRDA